MKKSITSTKRHSSNPITITGNRDLVNDVYDDSTITCEEDVYDCSNRLCGTRSLPPPRAPYLNSRGISGDRWSKIPQIKLPETAASDDSLRNRTSFGSLRNNLFYYHDHRTGMHHQSYMTGTSLQSLPVHVNSNSISLGEWASGETPCSSAFSSQDPPLSSSVTTALSILESSKKDSPLSFSQDEHDSIQHNFSLSQDEHGDIKNKSFEEYDLKEQETHSQNPDTFPAFDLDF